MDDNKFKKLEEFYKDKISFLERESDRYRSMAQKMLLEKKKLENVVDNLQIENDRHVKRAEYYRTLYLKEKNKND